MQRSQWALDNAALELAVRLGNDLGKPVVVFFAPVPSYPGANQRNLRFLAEGVPDIVSRWRHCKESHRRTAQRLQQGAYPHGPR